ncbi:MAG TPA: hypothetical protein VF939_05310 [Puia sp.]
MNVRKHAALTRTTTAIALFLSVLTLGSCKKTVYQTVDQAFSATYSVSSSSWTTSDGGKTYTVKLNVPEVDNVVVGSGGVIVYASFDNGATFEALPEVYGGVAYGAYHQNGTVSVDLTDPAGVAAVTAPTGTVLIKVIILDATALPN